MSRRKIRGVWLLGLVCLVTGWYFIAQEEEQSAPKLPWVSSEGVGVASTSSIHGAADDGRDSDNILLETGDSPEQDREITDSGAFAVEANTGAAPPVAGPPADQTPFLDPDVESVVINQSDINRTSVNVGKYLDPNGTSLPLSASDVKDVEETPINIGAYLNPDPKPHEPLITIGGESGTTQSQVGRYLDPDAEAPEAFSVEPEDPKDAGPSLEVDS
jgi:hypothetical protein